eukprot:c19774_g1_i1.p1 GENE.c19774_g1_i1~~c19774_g1_i1.p1  ORF type:complete len:206 (+),score=49.23 c19774_g1_i1:57-674(+)
MIRWRQKKLQLTLLLCLVFLVLLTCYYISRTRLDLNNIYKTKFLRSVSLSSTSPQRILFLNDSSDCKNTNMGLSIVADNHGFLCSRSEIIESNSKNSENQNGCCVDPQNIEQMNKTTNEFHRFFCGDCDETIGCCTEFPGCVSCCQNPKNLLDTTSMIPAHALYLYSHNLSLFDFCSVACRTSSFSVIHENKFRNSTHRFCYRRD